MIKLIQTIVVMVAACATVWSALAQMEAHEWNVRLKVIDEAEQPVVGAEMWVGYMTTNKIVGLTDSNGVFVASHLDRSFGLVFYASKSGFYSFRNKYELGFPSQYNQAKWNPTQTIILKKIGQPIAMYAKKAELKMPKENEPVGFDLMAGDWVAPYGKGNTTDLFFSVQRKVVSEREYDAELKLTFPNVGDGVVKVPPTPNTGSPLKMPRSATESGYEPSLDLHYTHLQHPESVLGYFFRVRTVLDENGNVKSALYGKIQGNVRFYVGTMAPSAGMGFDYYFNPTSNSRNVEFDPKQNLMKNLKPLEGVSEP